MRHSNLPATKTKKQDLSSILVILSDKAVTTTSLIVAEKFSKRHNNVVRAVQNLECSVQFNVLNFERVNYLDAKGETRSLYNMTRDGFMFLVMGFTGKEAALWKEQFIGAFNFYEKEYNRLALRHKNEEWNRERLEGKAIRRELTDVLKTFEEYAKEQGSQSASMYYMNTTKMVYKTLFEFHEDLKIPPRERLTERQLSHLRDVEAQVAKTYLKGMAERMPYKDIYQFAKSQAVAMVEMLDWRTPVLARPDQPGLSA